MQRVTNQNGVVVTPVNQSPVISKKKKKIPATRDNFNIVSKQDKFRCSFCSNNAHSNYNCKKYDRLDCCKVLGLCTLCTDPRQSEVNCLGKKGLLRPCWDYKSSCHAGAMCPGLDNFTLDTNTCYHDDNDGSSLLLPKMEVVFVYEGFEYRYNALIDSYNKRSYLADSLPSVLNCRANKLPTREFVMKNFLGSARKRLHELKLLVKLLYCACSIPFLVDKHIDFTFKVKGISSTVFNS